MRTAASHPEKHLIVLCGPTHVAADVRIRPNLHVLVGAAEHRPSRSSLTCSRAAGRLSEKFTERGYAKGNAKHAADWGLANDNSLAKTATPLVQEALRPRAPSELADDDAPLTRAYRPPDATLSVPLRLPLASFHSLGPT